MTHTGAGNVYRLIALASTLLGASAAWSQSSREVTGEGKVIAVNKHMRHLSMPTDREQQEFATRTELWIVRIDRWGAAAKPVGYYLVRYWLYARAVSDNELNKPRLKFQFREPAEMDGKAPCQELTPRESDPFHYRTMRADDFQPTKNGRNAALPALKDLPCLVLEKPPIVVGQQ